MKILLAFAIACMCILAALAQDPTDGPRTTRDGDRPTTERPTRDFPDDGTVLDCQRTAAGREAILNCDCMLMRDVDGCAVCPADCPDNCPTCDLTTICLNGQVADDDGCRVCECMRDTDDGDVRDTIDYIRDQLRCHPDCIRIRQDTNICNTTCNSTAVHMVDYNECDEERPCENDGRCAIVGANIQRCVSLPDLNDECSNYDPVDDGTRGEDDEDEEREMERYSEDFNEGAEDRYLARNLMESVNECGNDLRCNDQGICVMATGPCADMRRSDNDVDCDDDGNFDTRQCRRQQDDTYMCWCANPQDGRPDHSTMMIVNAERDFSRSDCIRRIFRNCTVRRGGRSYQAIHGERIIMDTDTACRQCRCDNGTAAACQNVESARCPTRNQERACTRANGDTIANGERVMIGDGNMCGCKDGDLQCTRDTSRGGEDEEEDNDEMMCRMCASMGKKLVCGPNAITYPNRCSAMRCGKFTADEISDGPCPNAPVCDEFPCRDGRICIRTGGASCTGRCEPNDLRECVDRTNLRCPFNTTVAGDEVVCGSNGRSYRSFCHMIKLGPPNVRVAHTGRCDSPDCAGEMVCGTDKVTYDSSCHLRTLSANARVDHTGACEEDTTGMMTGMQLCDKTRTDNRCPRADCMTRVMPREGCCPICGGLTTIALDSMRLAEETITTGEKNDVDDILYKLQDSDLITDNVLRRCKVHGAYTTTTQQTNLEVSFEAKDAESDHDYCKLASEDLADTLNSDVVTLPVITNFASAAVSAPLVADGSGAPALTASCLAIMMASIFATVSLFF